MPKEAIFSKLKLKDYDNELEKILEEKGFSGDVKNLLLSMLYKIQTGYEDYETVKRDVISKKQLCENINKMIQETTFDFTILRPNQTSHALKGSKKAEYNINLVTRKMEIYPNEQSALNAIYGVEQQQLQLQKQYESIKEALSQFFFQGRSMDHIEMIRDFTGWTWSCNADEIQNVKYNLFYQNIRILLGNSFLEEMIQNEEYVVDYIELLQNRLIEQYGKKLAHDFFYLLVKLVLQEYLKHNPQQKQDWKEKRKKVQDKAKKLENKANYLEELSLKKKQDLKRIQQLDQLLSSKKQLEQEFIKRNEMADDKTKLFSIQHLVRILKKEKEALHEEITDLTKQMDPKILSKTEEWVKNSVCFLEDLDLEEKEESKKEENDMVLLQKIFLDCCKIKTQKIEFKKDLIDMIYHMRYYHLIPIEKNKQVKDKKQWDTKRRQVLELLYDKAKEGKVVAKITEQEEMNFVIFSTLLEMRNIDLGAVEVEVIKVQQGQVQANYYDGETKEASKTIEAFDTMFYENHKKRKKQPILI